MTRDLYARPGIVAFLQAQPITGGIASEGRCNPLLPWQIVEDDFNSDGDADIDTRDLDRLFRRRLR